MSFVKTSNALLKFLKKYSLGALFFMLLQRYLLHRMNQAELKSLFSIALQFSSVITGIGEFLYLAVGGRRFNYYLRHKPKFVLILT